jgi:long-chain acyl-CoA synthetase
MVHRLVEHVAATGAPCDGFKTIVYGGGPMYAEDIRRALATMGRASSRSTARASRR